MAALYEDRRVMCKTNSHVDLIAIGSTATLNHDCSKKKSLTLYTMLLPAFLQTSKSTTVVRSHACRVRTQGYHNGLCGLAPPHYEHSRRRRQTAVNSTLCFTHYSSFHHHKFNDRQQIRSLKGPATTRTLLGSFSSLTSAHSGYAPEIEALYHGNKAYITRMSETNPKLLQRLANDGQSAFYPFH